MQDRFDKFFKTFEKPTKISPQLAETITSNKGVIAGAIGLFILMAIVGGIAN